jgi:RNA polymerase sigma factor (sigma-70 family)
LTTTSYHESEPRPRLTAAQRELVAEHWEYALKCGESLIYASERTNGDWQGAVGEALCQAAMSFDPSRGYTFKTYLVPRVRGAILDNRRASRPKGYRREQEHRPLLFQMSTTKAAAHGGEAYGDDIPLDERLALTDDSLPVGWEAEYEDEVKTLARRMPRNYGPVFVRLYLHASDTTMKAAGQSLGFSESRISQIHSLGCEILRQAASA